MKYPVRQSLLARRIVSFAGKICSAPANVISVCRILLTAALFFALRNPVLFLILYLAAGLSDVLDGYIARRTNTQSKLGARLDSVADFVFFAAVTAALIVWLGRGLSVFYPWLAVIILLRCASVAVAACKYRTFAMLHTWGNKVTGLLIFFAPLLYLATRQAAVFWPVCIAALLSAAEELAIHLSSPTLDLNRSKLSLQALHGGRLSLHACHGAAKLFRQLCARVFAAVLRR